MTREEWDVEWSACLNRLRAKEPGMPLIEANALAVKITTARYGPRPAGLPLWLRLTLRFISKTLEGKPMMQRIMTSISFAAAVAAPLYAAAAHGDSPGGAELTIMELLLIVWPALLAGYGNFKSNTTKIMPNRAIWTPAERKVEAAKSVAKELVDDAKVVAEEKVASAKAAAEKR